MDFNSYDYPFGIEMRIISKMFGMNSNLLSTAMFSCRIEIDGDFIRICATASPESGISKSVEWKFQTIIGLQPADLNFPRLGMITGLKIKH